MTACQAGSRADSLARWRIDIPDFAYHPDPIATGSAVEDDRACSVCGQPAELRYTGPVYGRHVDVLCLRCIHSGRASEALAEDAEPAFFVEIDDDSWEDVSEDVVEQLLHRTPGFIGWQQERWLAHCDDACLFLGPAGWRELEQAGADAVAAIREETIAFGWAESEIDAYLRALSKTGDSTAYLFRCRVCGLHRAYSDLS